MSDELRKKGLDEADTKDLVDLVRAYLGASGLEKEKAQQQLRDYDTGRERRQA
jgi:hypothetical protein